MGYKVQANNSKVNQQFVKHAAVVVCYRLGIWKYQTPGQAQWV